MIFAQKVGLVDGKLVDQFLGQPGISTQPQPGEPCFESLAMRTDAALDALVHEVPLAVTEVNAGAPIDPFLDPGELGRAQAGRGRRRGHATPAWTQRNRRYGLVGKRSAPSAANSAARPVAI